MGWRLYLDDVRTCPYTGFVTAKSSDEALAFIALNGMPDYISFDHDLGGLDTAMVFLHKLADYGFVPTFTYGIHSSNPVGIRNLFSFIESWKDNVK